MTRLSLIVFAANIALWLADFLAYKIAWQYAPIPPSQFVLWLAGGNFLLGFISAPIVLVATRSKTTAPIRRLPLSFFLSSAGLLALFVLWLLVSVLSGASAASWA